MTFAELGLAEPILRAVAAEGYTAPTPIQLQAIPGLLAGRDLLGSRPDRHGKDRGLCAADSPPAVPKRPSATPRPTPHPRLVLAPTRELAVQIGESFRVYGRYAGLRHTVVFGGVGQQPQAQALRRGLEILIATPGRLLDLLGQGLVDLAAVEVFVLDEADRMLDMGFIPDVRRIVTKLPSRRQTVMFSATMPDAIGPLVKTIVRDPVRVRIAPVRATAELIEQSVIFVPRQQKAWLLASLLSTRSITRALVFTRTKHGADRVVRQLKGAGIRADAIHGNKSQGRGQRALADFKLNRTPVLVATDIAARGIDVEEISHVLNYDLPHEPETYVHRIGRTGRAGASGIAVSFCDDDERDHLKAIERLIRRSLAIEKAPEGGPSVAAVCEQAGPRGGGAQVQSVDRRPLSWKASSKAADRTQAHGGARRGAATKHRAGKAPLRRTL